MIFAEQEVLIEVFEPLPRGAPGSRESTARALATLEDLKPDALILDVGCGTGPHTLVLAQHGRRCIIALDLHWRLLSRLSAKIDSQNLSQRIWPVCGNMESLGFRHNCFDLIWAEGSVYAMGTARALSEWRQYLKPDGYISMTDVAWLKGNPPEAVEAFWDREYSGMMSIGENLKLIEEQKYSLIDHFVLPERDWWNCYRPLEARIEDFRIKYAGDEDRLTILDSLAEEVRMYREYSQWYGYVFYMMRREA